MDILDGWYGILVLAYLGAVALTLKLRPHWLLTPGADPLSLWLRSRRALKQATKNNATLREKADPD